MYILCFACPFKLKYYLFFFLKESEENLFQKVSDLFQNLHHSNIFYFQQKTTQNYSQNLGCEYKEDSASPFEYTFVSVDGEQRLSSKLTLDKVIATAVSFSVEASQLFLDPALLHSFRTTYTEIILTWRLRLLFSSLNIWTNKIQSAQEKSSLPLVDWIHLHIKNSILNAQIPSDMLFIFQDAKANNKQKTPQRKCFVNSWLVFIMKGYSHSSEIYNFWLRRTVVNPPSIFYEEALWNCHISRKFAWSFENHNFTRRKKNK